MRTSFSIHRTRIGKDIVSEFAAPLRNREKSRKVAILANGVPSAPRNSDLMEFLSRAGFWVISPRYRGTWESDGGFLKKEPTKDILEVIERLSEPVQSYWEGRTYTFPKGAEIHIFANSFGGPAALLLSKHPSVRSVVLLSPVVDWSVSSANEPLPWLFTLIRNAYGNAYRISRSDWRRLGRGKFYNPMRQLEKVDGSKILIYHAKDDKTVRYRSVLKFSKASGAKLVTLTKGGHFGFSSLKKPYYWRQYLSFYARISNSRDVKRR